MDWIYYGFTIGFTEFTVQIETLENHFANAAETYDQTTRQRTQHSLCPIGSLIEFTHIIY
jgi:hypothetical protein